MKVLDLSSKRLFTLAGKEYSVSAPLDRAESRKVKKLILDVWVKWVRAGLDVMELMDSPEVEAELSEILGFFLGGGDRPDLSKAAYSEIESLFFSRNRSDSDTESHMSSYTTTEDRTKVRVTTINLDVSRFVPGLLPGLLGVSAANLLQEAYGIHQQQARDAVYTAITDKISNEISKPAIAEEPPRAATKRKAPSKTQGEGSAKA